MVVVTGFLRRRLFVWLRTCLVRDRAIWLGMFESRRGLPRCLADDRLRAGRRARMNLRLNTPALRLLRSIALDSLHAPRWIRSPRLRNIFMRRVGTRRRLDLLTLIRVGVLASRVRRTGRTSRLAGRTRPRFTAPGRMRRRLAWRSAGRSVYRVFLPLRRAAGWMSESR